MQSQQQNQQLDNRNYYADSNYNNISKNEQHSLKNNEQRWKSNRSAIRVGSIKKNNQVSSSPLNSNMVEERQQSARTQQLSYAKTSLNQFILESQLAQNSINSLQSMNSLQKSQRSINMELNDKNNNNTIKAMNINIRNIVNNKHSLSSRPPNNQLQKTQQQQPRPNKINNPNLNINIKQHTLKNSNIDNYYNNVGTNETQSKPTLFYSQVENINNIKVNAKARNNKQEQQRLNRYFNNESDEDDCNNQGGNQFSGNMEQIQVKPNNKVNYNGNMKNIGHRNQYQQQQQPFIQSPITKYNEQHHQHYQNNNVYNRNTSSNMQSMRSGTNANNNQKHVDIIKKYGKKLDNQDKNLNKQISNANYLSHDSQQYYNIDLSSNKKYNEYNNQINVKQKNYDEFKNNNNDYQRNKKNNNGSSNNKQKSNQKYGPGGLQTLQFNTQKEKLVILDSKQTEGVPYNSNLVGFCQDFELPVLYNLPTPESTAQQLVDLAKENFEKFNCQVTDQTVISVKKYRNCVHLSISPNQNIIYHYDSGKIYFGAWKAHPNGQGEKYGQGVELVPGKYRFKGFFIDGKRNGLGTMIGYDGTAYVGYWQNGLKAGTGKQIDMTGIVYEGQWKEGKRSGYGKLINFHNNRRIQFQGVFVKGMKNGYGKELFQNGDTYQGNYVNHKFHGKGTYSWSTGASYTGQFQQGKRNGYGVWISSQTNYDKYQGYYQNDKKHGQGVYIWPNGAIYEGNFKDDLKHGEGAIKYQNGKVSKLVWKNGKAERKLQQTQNIKSANTKQVKLLSQRKPIINYNNDNQNSSSNDQSRQYKSFSLRSRPGSNSTQNLMSAKSSAPNQMHNFQKAVTFHHAKSMNKLPKQPNQSKNNLLRRQIKIQEEKKIKLNFDNQFSQFQKAIGKNWNKNSTTFQSRVKAQSKNSSNSKPQVPKDRPYQGIQFSTNINFQM